MFSSVECMLKARAALDAAAHKDPRWDQLVTKLMERLDLPKDRVIFNIGQLAQGNTNI